jgi:hypothetical protein
MGKTMNVYTTYIQEYWPFSKYLARIGRISRLGNTWNPDTRHLSRIQLRRSSTTALEGLPAQERLLSRLAVSNNCCSPMVFLNQHRYQRERSNGLTHARSGREGVCRTNSPLCNSGIVRPVLTGVSHCGEED